ncbi:MAG: hypothetical protein KAR38_05015, partial [Calditrichia bacterium]|nr:hypothetical protein [Calditrichia bacterium]
MFDSDIKKNFIFTALSIFVAAIIIFYLNKYLNLGDNKEQIATKVYFVDNISDAHVVLIDKFNREYEGEIEIVPVNLPFAKFSTNERKELLARSLRSKNDGIDIFAVDLIWVPR